MPPSGPGNKRWEKRPPKKEQPTTNLLRRPTVIQRSTPAAEKLDISHVAKRRQWLGSMIEFQSEMDLNEADPREN
ncbi:hypothetical protein NDU88_010616 [Pleurodeles waltl]|uniref:Uncharacterized protein n=1 Tax=Pleurodeles waltl TaxID=8319 RepID=A0AAV7Q2R4_PLEWA|nr:hypothetical protein NDU88_010616 [Pleurodeles waltl]